MTDPKVERYQLVLRIPIHLYRRIEAEKARRRESGGAGRPEATAVLLEAVDAYLTAIEKKMAPTAKIPSHAKDSK